MNWISVKDSLPPTDEQVLIWHPVYGAKFSGAYFMDNNAKEPHFITPEFKIFYLREVTHWSKINAPE